MPTIMSHAIVPITVAFALGGRRIALPVAIAGAVLAMLPDADTVSFLIGIDYADQFGHRGASHSFAAAAFFVGVVMALIPAARTPIGAAFLFISGASHGLLDTLTNGGLGAALLWPVSDTRFHAAVTPIAVSPIGGAFFSARGLTVLLSEALWVWLPCGIIAVFARLARRANPAVPVSLNP
jgi:inner membrane protein